MKCVIYRRVSTDMQAEEGFSLEAQRVRLEAYATSQGWTVVDDYCDEGFSAKNTDRPQMQRLITDIKKNQFDVILVYRLDRFVRSVLDLHELLQLMDKHDVKFKSATEVFDTTSATGRLFITMIATLAQWERETIAERVHMGMTKKAEQGLRNGAPAPYGYDMVDGKLIINQEEAKWVRYIFNRYTTSGSQSIAKDLNKKGIRTKKGENWSDFSVRYILKNPIYTGSIRWNFESASKGTRKRTGEEIVQTFKQKDFEPIIDNDTFIETKRRMEKRSTMAFRSDNSYPFSGVLKCQKCGYNFSGAFKKQKNGKLYRYYKCRGRINFGVCDVQAISEETIDEAFLDMLRIMEDEFEVEQSEPIMSTEEIKKQFNHLGKKKERAEELYVEGDISKERYHKMLEEIKSEETELLSLTDYQIQADYTEELRDAIDNIKNEWYHLSYETRKSAVHSVFKSITIDLIEKAVPPKKKAVVSITAYEPL